MNKRLKKKQRRKDPGYKAAEKLAEKILRDYGIALGKSREEYYNELMNNYTEKAQKFPS